MQTIQSILISNGIEVQSHTHLSGSIIILTPTFGEVSNVFYFKVYSAFCELHRNGFIGMICYTFNGTNHAIS